MGRRRNVDDSTIFWSIANARRAIGYAPQDDSEVRFRELIAAHVEAALARGNGNTR